MRAYPYDAPLGGPRSPQIPPQEVVECGGMRVKYHAGPANSDLESDSATFRGFVDSGGPRTRGHPGPLLGPDLDQDLDQESTGSRRARGMDVGIRPYGVVGCHPAGRQELVWI